MKKIILSIFLMAIGICIYAQNKTIEAANQLVAKYQLNEKQAETMLEIQQRKERNNLSIQSLEETNPDLFRQKKRAIYEGTQGSIKRLLTEEQMLIYRAEATEKRKLRAAKVIELKESGASPAEVEDAMLLIDERQ